MYTPPEIRDFEIPFKHQELVTALIKVISRPKLTSTVEQQIFRFNIAMYNMFSMQIAQSVRHLRDILRDSAMAD
jgi:hypothetical protein